MRKLILTLVLASATTCAYSQTEMGGDFEKASKSWVMINLHSVWTPQFNNAPNLGFGFNAFSELGTSNVWLGGAFFGTGIRDRQALAINMGLGTWIIGTSKLGAFGYLSTGLGVSADRTAVGFNFFNDVSTTWGLASQAGLGGSVELFSNIKVHLAGYGMWFTDNKGATPLGVQLGLTLGGR